MPHISVRQESARRPSLVTFFGLLGLITLTAGLLNFTQPAARAASVFTVNSTGDGADSNTADNLCDDGAGNCTLRAAIQQANTTAGADTITFQIGSGPQTIRPTQPLPEVTEPVVIDGSTQPGYAGAPIIGLDGSAATSGNGLVLTGGDSTVRALVINRFTGRGITLGGAKGGNRVEGCYIGTDLTGALDRGNGWEGISLSNSNNVIGGRTPAARNVISGNRKWGIDFERDCCTDLSPLENNVIQGNYIGLSAAGDAAIPNWEGGVRLRFITTSAPISNNLIGGTAPGAGNVISGNAGNGLVLGNGGYEGNNAVQGNLIGTDATGSFAIPNFNGVLVAGVNNLIGGTTPAARNVISGNNGHGVVIEPVAGNTVRGNIIGANAALTGPIPNLLSGVAIKDNHDNSVVGGTGAGEANVIAFNAVNGLELFSTGEGHRLRGNSVFSNGGDIPQGNPSVGLGIDLSVHLESAGVTPNDAGDTDFGPNRLQNFPVLTSVTPGASSFNVKGTLDSRASTTYDLDFYANGACDSSGFGEGARRVGSAQVTTDSGGDASFDLTFNVGLAANQVLTATATDPAGNTSEFSQCAAAGATAVGSVNFQQTRVSVNEGGGAATFVLTRTGGSAGAVTVNYSVRDKTARAGSDFTATSGTLTFADGETSKSFTVPVLEDDLDEPTFETAVVSLSTAGDLDALGPRSTATLTITDNDPALTLSVGDVSAAEGKPGTTAFEFPVTLSAASGRDGVTLTYETESGTATGGGDDFFSASSTLTIPAGEASGKITIFVYGDSNVEPDETFFVNITSATSADIADGRALGTILNDDVALTFNVNSTGDGADVNPADGVCKTAAGDCTLRAAIEQAGSTSGTDTINIPVTGTINLTGALPDVTDNLIINGPGSSLLTVRRDTGGDYRIFYIVDEENLHNLKLAVSISGLTVANGRTAAGELGEFGGNAGFGGGLVNGGTLALTDVKLTGNGTGAGGVGSKFNGGKGGDGGAVYNFGALTMTDVTLTGNSTGAGGAGSRGGKGGDGGAIYNMGTLTMIGCVVRGNSTGRGGEAKSPSTNGNNDGTGGGGGDGGGIACSFLPKPELTMTDCVVSENTTGAGGDSNVGGGRGGGSGFGAGIFADSGMMALTRVSVSNNAAGAHGKAPLGTPGVAGGGGGIYFSNDYFRGSGTLTDSTVSGNSGGGGHGILNWSSLRLTNTTISGNRLDGTGGAVHNGGAMTLTNCTVAANEGPGVSGGAVVRNTIIAANAGGAGPDVSGAFSSQGHNIIGNAGNSSGFTAAGDKAGTSAAPIDPRLGPLADNGGPTLTHAPLAGSPALDAGDNALALDNSNNPLATDQRGAGFPRYADAADADTTQTVDIGAFEAHPSVEDVAHRASARNTPLSFSFNVGDAVLGISSVTASSNNQTLLPDANLSLSGGGSARTLQLTPAANLSGTATVTLTVNGANGRSMSDTFVLEVVLVNAAPSFIKGADQTVAEDTGPQTIANWAGSINPGSADEAGQSVSFVVTGNTNPALFSSAPAVSPGGTLTYTPAPNASGSASISLVARDDGGTANGGQDTSAAQTFTINVTPVNDPPVAEGQAVNTQEDSPRFIAFAAADAENQALTFSVVSGPAHGTLSGTGSGRTYTPAPDYNGPDSFTFKATDASGADSQAATVSITVVAFNDAPVNAVPAQQVTEQNTPLVFSAANSNGVSVADVDAGANPLRVTLSGTGGTLTLGSTSGLTFTAGDGSDDAEMTFDGTQTALNAALDGLTFKPDAGFIGLAGFLISTNDQGFSGSGGLNIDTDFVTIVVRTGTFEFSRSSYTAGEGSGAIAVTVRRTGDTSEAASVNYATDDGSVAGVSVPCSATTGAALDRCDFTKALGRLLFLPGETEKTIQVLLSDDSYVEGTETALIRLSGISGAGMEFGLRKVATLEITDDAPETSANPIDDSGKFVRQHYHDFLSREPDAPGLAFWTNEIEKCGADAVCREVRRINVSAAFFLSIEFQETGYLVERMYKVAFGDAAGVTRISGAPVQIPVPVVRRTEFLSDSKVISDGVIVGQDGWPQVLESKKNSFAFAFVLRQRFTNAFPAAMTAGEFVDKLFRNAGVTPATAEREAAIAAFGAGGNAGRAAALRKVAESASVDAAEKNRAFVLMQFFGYLQRDPDAAPDTDHTGYRFWLDKLDQFGGNFVRAEMVKAFITSDEYRKRFGQ